MAERVVLIGMMGTGKTTVGELLAQRLGWRFIDTDREVETRAGKRIAELVNVKGESYFRDIEGQAVFEALSTNENAVVAFGGGAVVDESSRRVISSSGTVVWLRARIETLVRRLNDTSDRPLLGADPLSSLTNLQQSRNGIYHDLADVVVDVDDLSPDQVVNEIQSQITQAAKR